MLNLQTRINKWESCKKQCSKEVELYQRSLTRGMVYKSSLQLVTIPYILLHGTMMRTFALVGRTEEHHNENMD